MNVLQFGNSQFPIPEAVMHILCIHCIQSLPLAEFLLPYYSNAIQIFRSIEAEVQHNWLQWENKVIFIPFQTPAMNINIKIFIDMSLIYHSCVCMMNIIT